MKIIIVGGVAGGATAATRLRRLSETDQIILLEKDEFVSFANCGLPYHIGGVIEDRDELFVQTIPGMEARYHLDIRNFSQVTAIDTKLNRITIKEVLSEKIYFETYDKLIIATGAKPIKPNLEGLSEADNVFTLTNVASMDQIIDYIKNHDVRNATVIGGGFIGIEVAENLTHSGIDVAIVEKLPQVMRPFDFEMAQIIHRELNDHDVRLILGDGIKGFQNKGKTVLLESGKALSTDMTILAIGVLPNNELAKGANIKLGPRGHIVVSETYNVYDAATNLENKDVFAIGDVIEVLDFIDGSRTAIPLAWPANRQARLVADHINNLQIKATKLLGTSIIKVFDKVAASVGNNEAQIKMKGYPYMAIHAVRGNHAGYYPGATDLVMKIIFHPETGKIYGAQIVGQDGVDKRIDVIATVMRTFGTVFDLSDLQLAYAPPFGSAKDPVNILGYIAENIKMDLLKMYHHTEIEHLVEAGAFFLDVRTTDEFHYGHIMTAINIPIDELRERIDEIKVSKETPIYVNCESGARSYNAISILRNLGYSNLYNLSGGFMMVRNSKYLVK
jgi:NADPH-dependent 2,4-dienoyl-CoA reductase/sulfur reductase-like enzyme/rhodanese-related sulfurtransferase